MAKRLVLKMGKSVPLSDLYAFVDQARKWGLPGSTETTTSRGKEVLVAVSLPNNTVLSDKGVTKVRSKTAKAQKVEEHVKENAGQGKAYVPPEGRKTAPKRVRAKCPVCNIRKQVATVSGVKTIKPHTSHGEPCAGSGTQVK